MSKSKLITAIVPTYGRKNPLLETIKSVIDALQFAKVEYQIIIVDNNTEKSFSNFAKKVANDFNCEYLFSNINGPCQARNLAVFNYRLTEFYSFLDDDIYLYSDYYSNALSLISKDSNIDIIVGRTMNSSASLTSFIFVPFMDPRNSNKFKSNIWHVSGGNFFSKSYVLNKILFDENYFGYSYAEDLDFGFRAKNIGCTIVYSPAIRMLHFSSNLGRNLDKEVLEKIIGFSYFWKKNFKNKYVFFYLLRILSFLSSFASLKKFRIFFIIIKHAMKDRTTPESLFDFKKQS